MSDLVERIRKGAVYPIMIEAADRIEKLEDAIKQFGEFLEPMRFDRKSDDEKAIELDRLYRNILGVK